MKVKKLQTYNFMGLSGERTYEFNDQLAAFCGENGQGKTSVLNALRYGLTGVKPDGELITKGKEKASVLVEFEDGTSIARMEFAKDGKPAAYYVDKKKSTLAAVNQKLEGMTNGKKIPELATASDLLRKLEPEKFGETLLGYLPETMTAEDVCGRIPGITETAAKAVRDILPEGEFGFKELDRFYKYCVEKRRDLKNRIKAESAVVQRLEATVQAPKESKEELMANMQKLEEQKNRAAAYTAARREYERLKKAAENQMKLIKAEEEQAGNSNPAPHTKEERDSMAAILDTHRKTVTTLFSTLQAMKNGIDAIKKAVESIRKPICPLSEKLVCTTDKTPILEELKSEYKKAAAEYNNLIRQYAEAKARAEETEAALRKLDADVAEAKRLEGIRESIRKLKETMPQVPEEPKAEGDPVQFGRQLEEIRAKLTSIQNAGSLAEEKKNLAKDEEELAKYVFLASAFSPKGEVKQALVVYYLGEFENQLNQLAGRIFPGMSIRLVPEKGVTVSVDSKGTGEYMSISSLSGGEKACLTFLLMSLLSNITGCRVLILDELSVMDNTTLATFLDVLKENKAEYDLALLALVDHEDSKRILEEKGVPVLAV